MPDSRDLVRPQDARQTGFTVLGQRCDAPRLDAGLHVVATPVGNLADISLRALSTLAGAAAVVAEDTRVTRVLLSHYGISTPQIAYHEHNAAAVGPQLLARLAKGEALALVSDAGTPLVSDPGYRLVVDALDAGIRVIPVPGASAVLAALVAAGLPSDRFFFEGFLPQKQAARRERLGELMQVPGTLVFFESPRRLADMLADAASVLGPRPAAIARELTKLFEEIRRAPLDVLASQYAQEDTPKGEIVVLIGHGGPREAPAQDEVDQQLREALKTLSVRDAAAQVAARTGLKRRELYARAIELASHGSS
ncbi:MAG: 16S rRNA (cytidine(1402)-2'-O)-methyltransferase, partial [Alphaproteobacteria bacterium]|nr:16S rRNA (cytidine(1402)-2'-O)-methyltransferase [Alphaproteobacteria bacterium]